MKTFASMLGSTPALTTRASSAKQFSELCHGASEKREKFSAALQGGGLLAGCPGGPASSAGVNYAEVGRFVNG